MLILAHADGLRVDLYEFSQRIHESAPYGDGSAHGDVVVGEFLARQGGGRVDRCAVFVYHENLHFAGITQRFQKPLGLAAGGTVAKRDSLDVVAGYKAQNRFCRAFDVGGGRGGINYVVGEQIAVGVETYHFASCAETGIDTHDAF